MPTYTLIEAADSCAISAAPLVSATIAASEAADSCAISGQNRTLVNLPIIGAADSCSIVGSTSFLTTAAMPLAERADTCVLGSISTDTVNIEYGPPGATAGSTTSFSACDVLGGGADWTRLNGDYYDANGHLNGPVPHYQQVITASPWIVDISGIEGDLYVRAPFTSWNNPIIDGTPVVGWTVDPSSNASIPLPSNSNPGGFIKNESLGNSLSITTPHLGTTITIDRVAQPPIVSYPDYVGASNTPSIRDFEMTDYASLQAWAGYNLNAGAPNQPWAFNPEFGVDATNGLKYLRFSSDPDWSYLIAWFLPLGANYTSVNIRYCIMAEGDVDLYFNELGMKLPGLENQTGFPNDQSEIVSWRMWHTAPSLTNPDLFGWNDYFYNAETTGFPTQYSRIPMLKANRWYCVEQRLELNTAGQANGYGAVWLNGHLAWEYTNARFRNLASTVMKTFFMNVYHGGTGFPTGEMHYRVARLAVSTNYIGLPPELAPPASDWPAWRRNLTVGQFYDMPAGTQLTNLGGGFGDANNIIGYQGLAQVGGTSWYTCGNAGHPLSWNYVLKIDFSADAPAWSVAFSGTASPPSAATCAGPPQLYYYADNRPVGSQTYSNIHWIPTLNKIFKFGCTPPPNPSGSNSTGMVSAFRLADNDWDLQNSPAYAFVPFASPFYWLDMASARHPTTNDVYIGNALQQVAIWRAATQTWTGPFYPTGQTDEMWAWRCTCMDGGRNRWVTCYSNKIYWMDTTNNTVGNRAISDPTGTFATDLAALCPHGTEEPYGFTHDTDNDRYIVSCRAGAIWALNPVSGAATKLGTLPGAFNGFNNRAWYFEDLGGVVFCFAANAPMKFLPTRL